MDVIIVTPEPGRHAEIGQQLLALADHPYDVKWVTWPTAGYQIPLSLFEKFEQANGHPAYEEESAPEPKKRGRPKKAVASTDEPEKEE